MENIEQLWIKMAHFYMHHFFETRCNDIELLSIKCGIESLFIIYKYIDEEIYILCIMLWQAYQEGKRYPECEHITANFESVPVKMLTMQVLRPRPVKMYVDHWRITFLCGVYTDLQILII